VSSIPDAVVPLSSCFEYSLFSSLTSVTPTFVTRGTYVKKVGAEPKHLSHFQGSLFGTDSLFRGIAPGFVLGPLWGVDRDLAKLWIKLGAPPGWRTQGRPWDNQPESCVKLSKIVGDYRGVLRQPLLVNRFF
jgi:hypothetical protein